MLHKKTRNVRSAGSPGLRRPKFRIVCVLLLQDLLQSCARGGRRRVEDMCYERRRAEACVDESVECVFITAVPIIKLFA